MGRVKNEEGSVEKLQSGRPEKMSYESLEKVAHQLSEQTRQLYVKLQNANMSNMFKRVDYLFKVLENKESFDSSFVKKCAEELQEILTIPDTTEEVKEESVEA